MNKRIQWKSKFIDLLIVVIGISVAFNLNSWNESLDERAEAQDYQESFYQENTVNQTKLQKALEFSRSNINDIDTLIQIIMSKDYTDERANSLAANMMGMANYSPSITTMKNISASGQFDLIEDVELRKIIIETYDTYTTTTLYETVLSDYINQYVTPFFFENVRFVDFSSIHDEYLRNPKFENIVLGYRVLLNQQIEGYRDNLEKVRRLDEYLKLASS